ncbi:unnamed protein product [Effrenium voratum]|nr:unnamed protein product [Effrenium voratum]
MKPDVIQWNKRISRASGSRALQLLEEVQAVQLQPTVVSFTAALRALSGARVWRRALQLWQRMGQQGLEHDVVACNAAASCLEAWSEAAVFLRELQVRCLKVDTISHNAAISTCEASQWQQASALLDVLQVKFLQPTVTHGDGKLSCGGCYEYVERGATPFVGLGTIWDTRPTVLGAPSNSAWPGLGSPVASWYVQPGKTAGIAWPRFS